MKIYRRKLNEELYAEDFYTEYLKNAQEEYETICAIADGILDMAGKFCYGLLDKVIFEDTTISVNNEVGKVVQSYYDAYILKAQKVVDEIKAYMESTDDHEEITLCQSTLDSISYDVEELNKVIKDINKWPFYSNPIKIISHTEFE